MLQYVKYTLRTVLCIDTFSSLNKWRVWITKSFHWCNHGVFLSMNKPKCLYDCCIYRLRDVTIVECYSWGAIFKGNHKHTFLINSQNWENIISFTQVRRLPKSKTKKKKETWPVSAKASSQHLSSSLWLCVSSFVLTVFLTLPQWMNLCLPYQWWWLNLLSFPSGSPLEQSSCVNISSVFRAQQFDIFPVGPYEAHASCVWVC